MKEAEKDRDSVGVSRRRVGDGYARNWEVNWDVSGVERKEGISNG